MSFISSLDGTHTNAGVKRYSTLNQQHLEAVEQGGTNDTTFLKVRTTQSKIEIAEAAKLTFSVDGKVMPSDFIVSTDDSVVHTVIRYEAKQGQTVELEKIVSIRTSQFAKRDIRQMAVQDVTRAPDFDEMLEESSGTWEKIWNEIDIKIEGDRLSQKLLRLHNYHLMVSASPFNAKLDASVTARGLHGEAYRGHIFWDELFILPFYNIHFPDVAKSLLMYRYRRLEKARAYAKEYGYKGAMFPWQSGSDGREETQVLHLNPVSGEWGDDHSSLQRHVSLAVAYNVWQYFHTTNDINFIEKYGAEMFFEICRFWASKAQFDETTGKYSIKNVMGPDEFHEKYPGSEEGGLTDNAYTNIMVSWMFTRVPDLLSEMSEGSTKAVLSKINLSESEIKHWEDIHKKLRLVISNEGIISQYDGYFDLKELDWEYYRATYTNIHRMDRLLKAEGKLADDYKVAKQADTLMTFYNLDKKQVDHILSDLGYKLPEDYLKKNMEYYLARTSHGSTLSRVVHAQLANMIGDRQMSWDLYADALSSDFNDIQGGTTAEGIHAGVMAGTIMIAISTYAGIDLRGDVLSVKPDLPDNWKAMRFKLTYKEIRFTFDISHELFSIKADQDTTIVFNGNEHRLMGGILDVLVI
jgi:trehalose/maltose hydrolase-like predicted phosphorylase